MVSGLAGGGGPAGRSGAGGGTGRDSRPGFVLAASAEARAEGVRRGLRRREAEARCPGLVTRPLDTAGEARAFEALSRAVEDPPPVWPSTAPGSCSCPPGARPATSVATTPSPPASWPKWPWRSAMLLRRPPVPAGRRPVPAFISDGRVSKMNAGCGRPVAAWPGSGWRMGCGRPVAAWPGSGWRMGCGRPVAAWPGSGWPMARSPPGWRRGGPGGRGVRRTGGRERRVSGAVAGAGAGGRRPRGPAGPAGLADARGLAGLPEALVLGRFGPAGLGAHRRARGEDEHPPALRVPPPDLELRHEFDPPSPGRHGGVRRRALAERLLETLAADGLMCTRIRVEAETEHGERLAAPGASPPAPAARVIAGVGDPGRTGPGAARGVGEPGCRSGAGG